MKWKIIVWTFMLSIGTMAFAQKAKKVNWDKLDAMVEASEFRIESDWARAQADGALNAIAASGLQQSGSTGSRFNLIGNYNFLEMRGETVSAYLPYFGQRQISNGHYTDNQAIEFEGIPKKLSIQKNEKKKRYDISFDIDKDTETFQVNIQLYTNMKALMTVNSNQRFVIRYDGKAGKISKKEKGSK